MSQRLRRLVQAVRALPGRPSEMTVDPPAGRRSAHERPRPARRAAVVLRRRRPRDRDRRAAAEQHGPPVYVRHQIVHNDHVVRRLEELGAVFVEHEDEIPPGEICVLSAHGVAPEVHENCERNRGLHVVDAVCPLVSKVHAEARRYADSGHLIALVGHADHVEVIGTSGERPDSTIVVESPEEARALRRRTASRVAVITQTTLSLDDVAPIVDALQDAGSAASRAPRRTTSATRPRTGRTPSSGSPRRRTLHPRDRLADELERDTARRGGPRRAAPRRR